MTKSSIDEFADEYGAPVEFVPANDAADLANNSALPPRLFTYWHRFGFSKFLDGYFQIINPADYRDVLTIWLANTPFSELDNYHSILMDCFGNIRIWGEKTGYVLDLEVGNHAIYNREKDDRSRIEKGDGDRLIEFLLFGDLAENVTPGSDNYNIRLFFAAKEKLGLLGPNQIYAPVPAIPLGGQMRIEDLQIVDAPEYLVMAGELAPVRVITIADLARMAYGEGAEKTLGGLLKK